MDDNYWGTNLTAFGANILLSGQNNFRQIPNRSNQKYTVNRNRANSSSQFFSNKLVFTLCGSAKLTELRAKVEGTLFWQYGANLSALRLQ